MIDQPTRALFDALEQRAERCVQSAQALRDARATIERLERRLSELEAEQQRLRDELENRETPATPRSQGLAALMARRPRVAAKPPPAEPDTTSDVRLPETPPETVSTPSAAPAPQEPAPQEPALQEPASDEPQSRLPIGEAPSPQALLDEWYQRYPQAFFKGHTRPLKVGIHEDLVAREPWPEKLVRRALACYVHLPRYLKAVRSGAERVDLAGENAGEVTEGEGRYARRQLDELRAQGRTRRAQQAERQAQREKDTRLESKLNQLLAKHEQR